ncbi:MAG: EAL domain-containing protein, partial [Desulfobulbaceae bacterium]|nr:EAL domain-containing protein [Desulfobulbaceae bacterium]
MEIFIARQPIFNRSKKLFGYELLHRGNTDNVFPGTDGDRATSNLLVNTFLNIGLDTLVSSKWAFINFTEDHLIEKTALNLPPDKVIVEILEYVPPTPAIIAACMELKEKGYTLALDYFVFAEGLEPLVELADIVKIDFQELSQDEVLQETQQLKNKKVQLLAEKIETYAQFDAAWKMGFHFFQGYFFSQPEMLKKKAIPSSKIVLLDLLAEVNKKDFNLEKIENIILPDVSLSYKLLRYINSAYYYLLNEVTSIKHALVYLGESGVRQFVSLVVTSQLSSDKPYELLRASITMARPCELL